MIPPMYYLNQEEPSIKHQRSIRRDVVVVSHRLAWSSFMMCQRMARERTKGKDGTKRTRTGWRRSFTNIDGSWDDWYLSPLTASWTIREGKSHLNGSQKPVQDVFHFQTSARLSILAHRLALHVEVKLTEFDDRLLPPSTASNTLLSAKSELLHPNTLPEPFQIKPEMEATGKGVDIRESEGGKSAAKPHAQSPPLGLEDFWASAVRPWQTSMECQSQSGPGATWNSEVRPRLVWCGW